MSSCERLCDLKQKEVINICDGIRLGFVCDIEFDIKTARIISIIIPQGNKLLGFFCSEKEYRIPWNCICKIGDDIILVKVNLNEILFDCN